MLYLFLLHMQKVWTGDKGLCGIVWNIKYYTVFIMFFLFFFTISMRMMLASTFADMSALNKNHAAV